MERETYLEKYDRSTHILGRAASAITLIMLVGSPFLIGFILGALPDLSAAAKGFLSVFDAAVGFDGRLVAVDVAVQRREHRLRFFQPLRVDVIEGDFRVLQGGSAEDVAKDVFAENGAASAEECDFCHGGLPAID